MKIETKWAVTSTEARLDRQNVVTLAPSNFNQPIKGTLTLVVNDNDVFKRFGPGEEVPVTFDVPA